MPFVPVTNTAAVELRMLMDDQQVENTLTFRLGATLTPSNLLTLCNDLEAWWIANYAPQTNAQNSLVEIVATDLTTATGPSISVSPVGGDPGGGSGDFLPMNASLAISFRTASRGRSFRGRNYFVGLSEGQVTGNTVDLAVVAALQDAYELLLPVGGIFTDDWIWVVTSRFSGVDVDGRPIPRAAGLTTPITNVVIVDRTIDSARRRLPGRGR